MERSRFIAKLIGPICIAGGAGMLFNTAVFKAMFERGLHDHLLIYIAGLIALTSGLAILAMAGTLLGIGYFFSRQWLGFRASRRLNALMDGAGKYGPFVLFTSCICLYFAYRPYARLFRDYMYSSDGAGDPERMRAFLELRYFPSRIAPLHDLFWPVVIVVLSLVVVGFVWRWVKEAKKPVITAG